MIYLGGKLNFHKMNEDMIIEQLITDIFTDHDTRTRPMAFFFDELSIQMRHFLMK